MQPNGQQYGGTGVPMGPPAGYGMPTPSLPPKKKSNIATVLIFALLILLLLGSIAFGLWAFSGMQDYKTNSDKKASAAAALAVKKAEEAKDKEFVEREKSPTKEYIGPTTYGSVKIVYPKTWGAYVNEKSSGAALLSGYWHPSFVPGADSGTAFALRMEVTSTSYDQVLKTFDGKVKAGKVKVSPYKAPLVPSVLGSRVEGEINEGQKDYMVVFPLRDKTLKIWTESDQFLGDFDNIVLANLTFSP